MNTQRLRKIPATLAGLSFIAGSLIFVASLFGLTMDSLGWKLILPLHLGIFVLYALLLLVERPSKGLGFFRGRPLWVLRSTQIFFLFFVAVFFTFIASSHAASPEIVDGQYVLSDHGRIVRPISKGEYLHLKASELRFFASGWMVFYYPLALVWWFPRQDEWTVTMPD